MTPRDSQAKRFPDRTASAPSTDLQAGPRAPGRDRSLDPVLGNRRAESARGLAMSVAFRPNRAARDSRAVCSGFPPSRAVAGPAAAGAGAVLLTLFVGNRSVGSARTCKVRRASTQSRSPRFAHPLFPLSSAVHCRGTGVAGGAGWSLDRDQPNRASPRFLTRLCQENRIRFARRRFVLVLFPHGSTRRTRRSHAGHKNAARSRF
jgi:hypothetical protein